MFKRFLIVMVGLLFILPVFAKDLSEQESEYLAEIETALATIEAVETFQITGEQIIAQMIEADGVTVDQDITQLFEGRFINKENGQDSYISLEQDLTQSTGSMDVEVELTQEMLFINDELFVQFSDISPIMAASLYPAEWTLFEEAADKYQGLSLINAEQLLRLMDVQQLTTPFASLTDIITEIQQLDDATIENQEMTVYQALFDASLLFTDEYLDNAISVFDFASMGVDLDTIQVAEGAFIKHIYYIGQDDGLLHRSEAEIILIMTMNITAAGQSSDVKVDQTVTQTFDYFGFDEAIELPTP